LNQWGLTVPFLLDMLANQQQERGPRWADFYASTNLDFEIWLGRWHLTVSLLPRLTRRNLRPGVIPASSPDPICPDKGTIHG